MRPYGPAALRLCVGAVFLAHGAQKLFGLLNGPGVAGTARLLSGLGLPYATPLAVTLGIIEFCGGVLLLAGGGTRWVSLALLADTALMVWKIDYPHGVASIQRLAAPGREAELHLVLIGALLCLLLNGPGAWSIDERRSQHAEAQARGRARIRKV